MLAVDEELGEIQSCVDRVCRAAQKAELLAHIRYAGGEATGQFAAPGSVIESIAAQADVVSMASSDPGSSPVFHSWPAASAVYLASWRRICDFLLTASKPALRKTVNVRNGFPSNTPAEKARRKQCIEFLAELGRLPGAEELCEALNRIRRLPDPHYTESQWQFMQAVLEVLPLAAANLQVVFAEEATIDFAEYAQRALDAIGDEGDPTELGLQLGYRIRHILVDEFQDTNRVQVRTAGPPAWHLGAGRAAVPLSTWAIRCSRSMRLGRRMSPFTSRRAGKGLAGTCTALAGSARTFVRRRSWLSGSTACFRSFFARTAS